MADQHLEWVKEQDAQGFLVKTNESTATFDLTLADHLDFNQLEDNVLSVFVDKKALIGTEAITGKERRHIKR